LSNNKRFSTIIFSDSKLRAEHKMRQLANSSGEEVVEKRNDWIETSSRTYYAARWDTNTRAFRFNEAYVDYAISEQEVLDCIVPCLRVDESDAVYYNWKDHVHRF
jgi:hypothetical protein